MKQNEIDTLTGHAQLELGSSEEWLTFQAADIGGTVRNYAIRPEVLHQLSTIYFDASRTLLTPVRDSLHSSYVELAQPGSASH